jgi:hypothetical protein
MTLIRADRRGLQDDLSSLYLFPGSPLPHPVLVMTLPETMRGLRLEEFNKPYVYHTDLPVPRPGPGEIVLRVMAAGFCHTETVAIAVSCVSSIMVVAGEQSLGIRPLR